MYVCILYVLIYMHAGVPKYFDVCIYGSMDVNMCWCVCLCVSECILYVCM